MRSSVLFFSALIFSFCSQPALSQENLLVQKWLHGDKIREGAISLRTFKEWKSGEDYDLLAYVTLVDLNGDGKKELAIQSGCAAVGNCGLEIFSQSTKPLFIADMVQSITVLKTKSNGFYDLELGTHSSAYESYHRIFRFEGKAYRRKKCWFETYQIIDGKGKEHLLKKPKITYRCGQEF